MSEMPHSEAMEAGFGFARRLRDREFREHVTELAGKRGATVVATYAGEGPAALAERVRQCREEVGDPVLVVSLAEGERWGLHIEVEEGK